ISEVAIDILTGELRNILCDILHDVGHSLNPAIDLGQIEGAYIQGMGWLTSEQLVFDDKGNLRTHAPSTYKIPTAFDRPHQMNIALYSEGNKEQTIYRSKAVGEPPLMLAFSNFFAIQNAIASIADDADDRVFPDLQAPATPEHILNAINLVRDKMAKDKS
ncbi:MAG: molybdopterin-dependent oxidoreductase, partial [Alphaproteobacteria bacterium]|nr:molybdopterin-dependent oxidoreductase [Alphaproteobacteria bacterium]